MPPAPRPGRPQSPVVRLPAHLLRLKLSLGPSMGPGSWARRPATLAVQRKVGHPGRRSFTPRLFTLPPASLCPKPLLSLIPSCPHPLYMSPVLFPLSRHQRVLHFVLHSLFPIPSLPRRQSKSSRIWHRLPVTLPVSFLDSPPDKFLYQESGEKRRIQRRRSGARLYSRPLVHPQGFHPEPRLLSGGPSDPTHSPGYTA